MTNIFRKTRITNDHRESVAHNLRTSLLLRGGLALLIFLAWLTVAANGQSQPESSVINSPIHVTHVLGFEDVPRNAKGEISIGNEFFRFQRDGSPAAQVSISSIQNISLGEQDKQVGGIPMMLGKSAVPFAGGRAVSLFSHKKYDSLAIDYLDSAGGFHGVIFRLPKGQGETLKRDDRAWRTPRRIATFRRCANSPGATLATAAMECAGRQGRSRRHNS